MFYVILSELFFFQFFSHCCCCAMQFFVGVFVFTEDDAKEKSDFSRFFFFTLDAVFVAFAVAPSLSVRWLVLSLRR